MKRSAEILSGIAMQVFLVSLVVWIFCFSIVNNTFTVMQIRYPFLCAASVLAYGISYLLVCKNVPFPVYAILQILMTAGGVFLCLRCIHLEPSVTRTVVIVCALYGVTFPAGAFIAYEHVQERGMLIRFDLSAFMIIVLLILEKWIEFPARMPALIMCLISLGCSLLAIIAGRVGRYGKSASQVQGNRHTGRFLMLVCLGIVVVLTALIYFFASDTMEQAASGIVQILTAIAGAVKSAAQFLYHLFERFVEWLSRFFSAEDLPMEADAPGLPGLSGEPAPEGEFLVPVWFYILLAALAALLVVFIIYRLRKYRIRKSAKDRLVSSAAIVRESHLKSSVRMLFSRLRQTIRFRIDAMRYRNTVPGLLLWCERHASKTQLRKQQESAAAFLRRLAADQESEDGQAALLTLADLTEHCFYSGQAAALQAVDPVLIRKVKRAF